MPTADEPARILAEGLPAGLPSWDLTDDFLDDLDLFMSTSVYDSVPETAGQFPPAGGPSVTPPDHQCVTEQQADISLPLVPAAPADGDSSPTQRKLQSNRLAQARARQRRKARFCQEHLCTLC